jgi:hypothetical protein
MNVRKELGGFDLALTERNGRVMAHRLDCAVVKLHRRQGRQIANLYGCERMPTDVELCNCLKKLS